jgi:hypothetical protein
MVQRRILDSLKNNPLRKISSTTLFLKQSDPARWRATMLRFS